MSHHVCYFITFSPLLPHLSSLPSPLWFTRLDQAVTPLRDTPYETQLVTKAAAMRKALKEASYLIQKENSNPVSQMFVYFDYREQRQREQLHSRREIEETG